jgi:hypothetical protein
LEAFVTGLGPSADDYVAWVSPVASQARRDARDDRVDQQWEGFGIEGFEAFTWGTHDGTDPVYRPPFSNLPRKRRAPA